MENAFHHYFILLSCVKIHHRHPRQIDKKRLVRNFFGLPLVQPLGREQSRGLKQATLIRGIPWVSGCPYLLLPYRTAWLWIFAAAMINNHMVVSKPCFGLL